MNENHKRSKSYFILKFFILLLILNGVDVLLNDILPSWHYYINMNNLNLIMQKGWNKIFDKLNFHPHVVKFPNINMKNFNSNLKDIHQMINNKKKTNISSLPPEKLKGLRKTIIEIAEQNLHIPYKHGGIKPSTGFDCSGFVYYVYNKAGIKIPRAMSKQIQFGAKINRYQLKPGDLIFFKKEFYSQFSHVAIFKGVDEEGIAWVIHANHTGGSVRYEKLDVLPSMRMYRTYIPDFK